MTSVINSNNKNFKLYKKYLKLLCSLSRLFSESEIPYLHYRLAENIFCKAFQAENLARADIAFDAILNQTGIGIKTFTLKRKQSLRKIAEFNKMSDEILKKDSVIEKVNLISYLRNNRIDFATRTYDINTKIYHCITRKRSMVRIFEEKYSPINHKKINPKSIEVRKNNIIKFNDDLNEYSYNISKSTLYKNFYLPSNPIEIDISIINDPIEHIMKAFSSKEFDIFNPSKPGKDFIFLPLYSTRLSSKEKKVVAKKSGLNQWNAGGRKRDISEVYIPIPIIIHKKFPDFFPPHDSPFKLHLPTKNHLLAKVCQQNRKALMTKPNNALSDWLLRKVLDLKEGKLLNYEKLKIMGIDSVKITKSDESNYHIEFSKIGSYGKFKNTYLTN